MDDGASDRTTGPLTGTEPADQAGLGQAQPPHAAVDRVLLALGALARAGMAGLTLAELAAQLRQPKATVHRTLSALRFRSFANQDTATGRYSLGPAATQLAEDFFAEENLPLLLKPALSALCAETGELVHLGVLSGGHVMYLDKVEPERAIRVWSAIGRRLPALTTALGRAMFAFNGADREFVRRQLNALGLGLDLQQVWESLESARRLGYAWEQEENEPGIACLGVPLLRGNAVVAAISVTAPVERMTPSCRKQRIKQLATIVPPLLPAGIRLPSSLL
jgi:DNA-binding IclR family transcriptional regulator